MPINQIIAQGVRPIGADVPKVAGMLFDRQQAEKRNAMLDRRMGMEEKENAANAEWRTKQQNHWEEQREQEAQMLAAKQALAQSEWILQGVPKEAVAQEIPNFVAGYEKLNGPGSFAQADDAAIQRHAQMGRIRAASILGQGPPQPEGGFTLSAGGARYDANGNLIAERPGNEGGGQRSPYFTPVYTPEGVGAFDNRTGVFTRETGGQGVVKTADDPVTRGNVAEAEQYGKLTADKRVAVEQRVANMNSSKEALDDAQVLVRAATGSYAGNVADMVLRTFKVSLPGDQAIAALQVISARLVANVPRMEGPQSDRDVQMYKDAAGDLGNPNMPPARKLAAIRTIRMLDAKYKEQNPGGWSSPVSGQSATNDGNVIDFNALPAE